jgi:prepilin-type N-terminal cleavage/methylation domain-containing protein
MKKNAFTLVELLAVIIILGVLSVLITPKVINTITEAENNTNMSSAKNLVKSAELKAANNEASGNSENKIINYTTGENKSYLDYKGEQPEKGKLNIKENGQIAMAVKIGDNCYLKSYNSDDITVIPYSDSTCGENADVFINYTMPDLAISGDGLYEAQGEPGRYIYRGENPNNYLYLKENGTNVLYRIISYEPDGTIKVVRDESIGNIAWDPQDNRQNTSSGYYCNSQYGCNVWGNQSNTYYNEKTLSELGKDFYFYYYPNNQSNTLSIKYDNNFGTVTKDAYLNTYLNGASYYDKLDFKSKIETHSFNVGGVFYYNPFNNGYSGGDKGLLKEKEEEQVYTWNGKIALMNITEFVETSLSDTCTSVYSNYYFQPNNVTQTGTSSYTAKHSNGNWPCAKQNWNYKSSFSQCFLSANSYNRSGVWGVHSSGYFGHGSAYSTNVGVRPAFYLKSQVRLSGLGTIDSPYELVEE